MTNKTIEPPAIFQFIDARAYLKAAWAVFRAANPKLYSSRNISRRIGYSSPGYFSRILDGERSFTQEVIDSLVELFKLVGDEREYFQYLCRYSDLGDKEQQAKEDLFEKLISLNHSPQKKLMQSEFRFHKEWHHNAIWVALDAVDFKELPQDYETLAERLFPRVQPSKITESIALLKELGFIAPDENGCWRPVGKALFTHAKLHDEFVMHYWIKSLSLAKEVIMGKPHKAPRIYTNTYSCSEQAHARIHRRIDKLCKDIRAIVTKDDEKAKRVLHFQFQMFDLLQEKTV